MLALVAFDCRKQALPHFALWRASAGEQATSLAAGLPREVSSSATDRVSLRFYSGVLQVLLSFGRCLLSFCLGVSLRIKGLDRFSQTYAGPKRARQVAADVRVRWKRSARHCQSHAIKVEPGNVLAYVRRSYALADILKTRTCIGCTIRVTCQIDDLLTDNGVLCQDIADLLRRRWRRVCA